MAGLGLAWLGLAWPGHDEGEVRRLKRENENCRTAAKSLTYFLYQSTVAGMETFSPPHPVIDLATDLYYQLVHTLTGLLPPPLDDTQEALCTRNHAAIAKVAALLPVNANEADLAPSFACSLAQCIAARAQAEDVLRLLRHHAGDIGLVMRLNVQYGSMVRTSLSVHGRLMRVQALRHKREAIGGAANEDAQALHVAERSMLGAVDPDAGPQQAAWPKVAPVATRVEAPAADVDHRIEDNVSEDETNSRDVAFETWWSEQPWNQSRGSGETGLHEVVREAMARSQLPNPRLGGRELPANGRESPGRADYGCHIDGETAST
jgi:hypothetical protein